MYIYVYKCRLVSKKLPEWCIQEQLFAAESQRSEAFAPKTLLLLKLTSQYSDVWEFKSYSDTVSTMLKCLFLYYCLHFYIVILMQRKQSSI